MKSPATLACWTRSSKGMGRPDHPGIGPGWGHPVPPDAAGGAREALAGCSKPIWRGFAAVYDRLMQDVDYEAWADHRRAFQARRFERGRGARRRLRHGQYDPAPSPARLPRDGLRSFRANVIRRPGKGPRRAVAHPLCAPEPDPVGAAPIWWTPLSAPATGSTT